MCEINFVYTTRITREPRAISAVSGDKQVTREMKALLERNYQTECLRLGRCCRTDSDFQTLHT